jgi:hypothetical protein
MKASETASARPKLSTNLPRVAYGKRHRASEKRALAARPLMSLKRRVQALIRVAPGLGFDTSPSAITLAEALIARLSAMGEILDVV